MTGYFITSTDTNVGKTTAALCLMRYFKSQNKTVGCMKPVSAGCDKTPLGLRNDDAIKLTGEASIDLPYDQVNPYAFEPPIAPHIAAQHSGIPIQLEVIRKQYEEISSKSDVVIVEGAGGWLVPINEKQTMTDIAATLKTPVILVVGLKLGCLNHALLTANNIAQSELVFTGWIANQLDNNMLVEQENIETLKSRIQAPFIGSINYGIDTDTRKLSLVYKFPEI